MVSIKKNYRRRKMRNACVSWNHTQENQETNKDTMGTTAVVVLKSGLLGKKHPSIMTVLLRTSTGNMECFPLIDFLDMPSSQVSCLLLLLGTIVNRTYRTHKNLYIQPFLLTIFGPINQAPP